MGFLWSVAEERSATSRHSEPSAPCCPGDCPLLQLERVTRRWTSRSRQGQDTSRFFESVGIAARNIAAAPEVRLLSFRFKRDALTDNWSANRSRSGRVQWSGGRGCYPITPYHRMQSHIPGYKPNATRYQQSLLLRESPCQLLFLGPHYWTPPVHPSVTVVGKLTGAM